MRKTNVLAAIFAVLLSTIPLAGCLTVATYNEQAYKNATDLKAETDALIDKMGGVYLTKGVDDLNTKINAAYEYSAGLSNNGISAAQWSLIRNLYGTVTGLWRKQGPLGAYFRSQHKPQIDEAYDTIICVEANKKADTDCQKKAVQPQASGT